MIPEGFAAHTYAVMRIVFGTMFMTHGGRASERALSPPFGEDHAGASIGCHDGVVVAGQTVLPAMSPQVGNSNLA